jgi:hypothetical protein
MVLPQLVVRVECDMGTRRAWHAPMREMRDACAAVIYRGGR